MAGARRGVVFEKDYAAYMVFLYIADDVVFIVELRAAETDEEHLADVLQQLVFGLRGSGLDGLRDGIVVLSAGGDGQREEHEGEECVLHG